MAENASRPRGVKEKPIRDTKSKECSTNDPLSVPSCEAGSIIGAGEEVSLKECGSKGTINSSSSKKKASTVGSKISSDTTKLVSAAKSISTLKNSDGPSDEIVRAKKKAGYASTSIGRLEKVNASKTVGDDDDADHVETGSAYLLSSKGQSTRARQDSKSVARQSRSRKTPPRASTPRKEKTIVPVDLDDIDETVFRMKQNKYTANEINAAFKAAGHKFRSLRSYEHHWRKAKIAHKLGGSMPGGRRGRKAVRGTQAKLVRKAVPKLDTEDIIFLKVVKNVQAAFQGIYLETAKTLGTLFAAGVSGSVGRASVTPIIVEAYQALWEQIAVQFAQATGKQFSVDECKMLLKELRPDEFEKLDLSRVIEEAEEEYEVPEEFRIPELLLLEVDEEEDEDIWGLSDDEEVEEERSSDGEFNPRSRKSKSGAKGDGRKSKRR